MKPGLETVLLLGLALGCSEVMDEIIDLHLGPAPKPKRTPEQEVEAINRAEEKRRTKAERRLRQHRGKK